MDLFSQIPIAVLNKAGCARHIDDDKPGPKSRKKRKHHDGFYDDDEVRSKERQQIQEEEEKEDIKPINIYTSPPPLDEATILDDSFDEQITSNIQDPPKRTVETFDAIVQTVAKKMVDREVQTDESMITRPLSDNDLHRMNMQTFAPITPIPRPYGGSNPPLRIGLTLRGKKRRVFYPDLEEVENHV